MNVPRITIELFLFVYVCGTSSCLKEPDGSPLNGGAILHRRNRQVALNEYLVPPPPPTSAHSLRTGRVVNSPQPESPGYLSQLMSWLNPFNFASQPSTSQKSPAYFAPPYTAASHSIGPGQQFKSHGPLQLAPPGPQSGVPLYPPLDPSAVQHSAPILVPAYATLNAHAGPSNNLPGSSQTVSNLPPNAHSHLYNPPANGNLGVSKPSHGAHVPANNKKACNACNKVPWIPMQTGGHHAENYPPLVQYSRDYLPPKSEANHGIQHTATHEIQNPDFSRTPIALGGGQHAFGDQLLNPILYSGLTPPLYKANQFEPSAENSHRAEVESHFGLPAPSITRPSGQDRTNDEINNGRYATVYGNDDLTSSGTHVNQGHVSHGIEISEGLSDQQESFGSADLDSHSTLPESPSSFSQEYDSISPSPEQKSAGVLNHSQSAQQDRDSVSYLQATNAENHDLSNRNGSPRYRYLFKSTGGQNNDANHLSFDPNPLVTYGPFNFDNLDTESLNLQHYRHDSSKDSHVTTQTIPRSSPADEDEIHFVESPLLDLTKEKENHSTAQWLTSTSSYTDNTAESTVADDIIVTSNIYTTVSSQYIGPTESYFPSDIRKINSAFEAATTRLEEFSVTEEDPQIGGTSTISPQYTKQQDVSHIPSTGQLEFLWPGLIYNAHNSRSDSSRNQLSSSNPAQRNISSTEVKNVETLKNANVPFERQQNTKRNKQVQLIIPYTSDYTPIPFQRLHGDWSIRTEFERAQGRKAPSLHELDTDAYLEQESRNDIRVANQSHVHPNADSSMKLNRQLLRPVLTLPADLRNATGKTNNSIDVRRLQKNIDNWTIQEYSKPTISSTILPTSLHPYLLPSKKIPSEYLTTTGEPRDHRNETKDRNESVKTYSLTGFSFNEIEHEASASSRVEETRTAVNVVRVDGTKATADSLQGINKTATGKKSTWEAYAVSISPVNKERVYVVTPQPIPKVKSSKNDFEKRDDEGKGGNSQRANVARVDDVNKARNNLSEFEAIEKAYQVLPQAVNNLAVASTGKEDVPLWGIMEHEEFASLNLDEKDEKVNTEDVTSGPLLYTGHSRVSRAKR